MKMMRNLDAVKKMEKEEFLNWLKENVDCKDGPNGGIRIIFKKQTHNFLDIEFPIFYIYKEFRARDEFKEIQEKFTEKQIAEYESLQKKMSVEFYCFGVDYIDPYDAIEELDQFDYDDLNDMVINFYYKHQDDIRDNVLYDNKDRIVENLKTYLRRVNDYNTPKKIESVQELNDVRKMSEKEFANWFNENFRYYIVSEGCRINYKGDKNDRETFFINHSEWRVYREFKKSSEYKEFKNSFSKEQIQAYEEMLETVGDNIKQDNLYDSHIEDESLLEMTLATGIFCRNNAEAVTNSILYKEREYIVEKLKQIRYRLGYGVDISKYADQKFNDDQIAQIRLGLRDGLDVSKYADPKFDWQQMQEIKKGLEDGIDVSKYADPKFNDSQMEQIRKGLYNNLDVSKYADPKFHNWQMNEIKFGLKGGLDVSKYADPKFDWEQMREIREGLEKEIDISTKNRKQENTKKMMR